MNHQSCVLETTKSAVLAEHADQGHIRENRLGREIVVHAESAGTQSDAAYVGCAASFIPRRHEFPVSLGGCRT